MELPWKANAFGKMRLNSLFLKKFTQECRHCLMQKTAISFKPIPKLFKT
jgi:hypothetical protein